MPSARESFPEGSVLPPDVFVAWCPGTARAPAALLLQLATCPCLSPAGLVNERVEHVEEESHDCGRGGQDEVSDAAFVWVLGGARTPLLATGPPGVSRRPLGSLELQLLFFSLQFLPDQRSLRCGNLRQHLENTTGNTPRHPPGQAAACEPSPVPHQPASPCSAVAPAPATPGGCRCSRRSRAPLGAGGAAGGCRAASSRGAGGWIPVELELCYWWIQAGEGVGSSQWEAGCGDPNGIVQTAANGGAARGRSRRRGGGTTSPSSPSAGGDPSRANRSPASQVIPAGSQSQPSPSLCR